MSCLDGLRTGQVSSAPHCSLPGWTGSQAKYTGESLFGSVVMVTATTANETFASGTIQTTVCESLGENPLAQLVFLGWPFHYARNKCLLKQSIRAVDRQLPQWAEGSLSCT